MSVKDLDVISIESQCRLADYNFSIIIYFSKGVSQIFNAHSIPVGGSKTPIRFGFGFFSTTNETLQEEVRLAS